MCARIATSYHARTQVSFLDESVNEQFVVCVRMLDVERRAAPVAGPVVLVC
jgi:hypothetical protein